MAAASMLCSLLVMLLVCLPSVEVVRQKQLKQDLIIKIADTKEFKKLTRTRTNILAIFVKSLDAARPYMELYGDVAHEVKGIGTIAFVNCEDARKLCKKLKVSPTSIEIKHFKDGTFSQDYTRRDSVKSMAAFLRNPEADQPWDEDVTAGDVIHVQDMKTFNSVLKKKKPTLIMFYAPWCSFCKTLKPEFAGAATDLKEEGILAGVDLEIPELEPLKAQFNISGYPTLVYFKQGRVESLFGGGNNRDGIVRWMRNPVPPKEPEPEIPWNEEETDVVHLVNDTFQEFIEKNPSVLVMFYAPWCGHCKKMKPEYASAAATLKEEKIEGALAAVDATVELDLAKKYDVQGYPKVLYFKKLIDKVVNYFYRDGESQFPMDDRTKDRIVSFMKDPESHEPPPPEVPWEQEESDVVHLTTETFRNKLRKKKHGLVMFYAPWCGHCKAAKPEYTNAAAKFTSDNKVIFGALDCTKYMKICNEHDVTGYPTFKYFSYGKDPQSYVGKRMEKDFTKFMRDPFNPMSDGETIDPELDWAGLKGSEHLLHLTDDTFDDAIAESDSVMVMFYAPWCGHCKRMKPAYAEAAKMMADKRVKGVLATIDGTSHKHTKDQYGISGYPTIKYFQDGEYKMDFDRDRSAIEFFNWMKTPPVVDPLDVKWSTVPSNVIHLNEDNFYDWMEDKEHVMIMFYVPWCPHSKASMPEYDQAADEMINKPEYYFGAVECLVTGDLCTEEGVESYPAYHYYSFGKLTSKYKGPRVAKKFKKFFLDPPIDDETAEVQREPEIKKDSEVKKDTGVKKEPEVKDSGVKKEPEAKKDSGVKKEPEAKKDSGVKKEPEVKKDSGVKKEPEIKKDSGAKKEPEIKKDSGKKDSGVKKEPEVKKDSGVKKGSKDGKRDEL